MSVDQHDRYWEEAGRAGAPALDAASSVLVVGDDGNAVARAALGLGRAQARRRRVALGDLIGDAPVIQALVARDDDPHGIVDSFLYGVSLNRVARRTDDGGGNLFVLPSGTESVIPEEVFRSPRWRRLASGFREVGALLVLAAPSSAAGLEELAESLDGVVIVGRGERLAAAARSRALVTIPPPPAGMPAANPAARPAPAEPPVPVYTAPVEEGRVMAGTAETAAVATLDQHPDGLVDDAVVRTGPVVDSPPAAPPRRPISEPHTAAGRGRPLRPIGPQPSSPWLVPALAGTAVVGLIFYFLHARDEPAPAPNAAAPPAAAAAAVPDSAGRADSAAQVAAGAAADSSLFAVINPADSARASSYALELWQSITYDGARARVERDWGTLPAVSITPIVTRGDSVAWYKVRAGAYADSNTASARRATLRARGGGTLDLSIVRAPYALLMAEGVPIDSLAAHAARLRQADVPAYALLQNDGRVNLYAGAFETPAQAAGYRRTLGRLGVAPPIAIRIGDPYGMPRVP